jgi:DNA-directed RNA polymerase specialized sigma24 family protein
MSSQPENADSSCRPAACGEPEPPLCVLSAIDPRQRFRDQLGVRRGSLLRWLERIFPALKAETEDVIQSVALQIEEEAWDWDKVRNVGAWIRTLVFRRAVAAKIALANFIVVPEVQDLLSTHEDPADLLDLREAFSRLTDEQQIVVRLHVQDGLTFEEIAAQRGKDDTKWFRVYKGAIKSLQRNMNWE